MQAEAEVLTDDVLVKEALMIVENNLAMTKLIRRRYEKKFAQDGNKIGDTLNIRLPIRWQGRSGELMQPEQARERSLPLKIDQLDGQDLQFSNVDLTLKVDRFKERYLNTSCAMIANIIDRKLCGQYINCPNFAGVPGVIPADLDKYFDASVILSEYGVPKSERNFVISDRMEATIVNALKGLFQASQSIANQYKTGSMGHVIGFDWWADQNIVQHTVGALGGATPLTNIVTPQSGATIVTDGWTGAVATRLLRGDIITVADTFGVNPMHREAVTTLRQFVVTQDTDSDVAGNMTIPIFPSIEPSGAYKNVSIPIADGAAIKVFGSATAYANTPTRQGMAFHPEWLTAAFVDLDLMGGMEMSARAHSEDGFAIRLTKGNDIRTNQQLTRLDVLWGFKQMYEDFGVRICS